MRNKNARNVRQSRRSKSKLLKKKKNKSDSEPSKQRRQDKMNQTSLDWKNRNENRGTKNLSRDAIRSCRGKNNKMKKNKDVKCNKKKKNRDIHKP